MTKILDWIKKHVWQTILIGLAAFFIPLILVHVAYRISAVTPWFASTWSSGEVITYLAGFEAFIGTVFLGAIAVQQNEKAYEQSKLLISMEEKNSLIARYPNLEIVKQELCKLELDDVFEREIPYFCSEEIGVDYPLYVNPKNHFLILLTFRIKNNTNSNVVVKPQKLVFSKFEDSKLISYILLPSIFHRKVLDISPSSSDDIGIVINIIPSDIGLIYNGLITYIVVNNAAEEFQYSVSFSVILKEYPDITDIVITNLSRSHINS